MHAAVKDCQTTLRLTSATLAQVHDLARLWGSLKPLSLADVFAEAVRRAHQVEARKAPANGAHRARG